MEVTHSAQEPVLRKYRDDLPEAFLARMEKMLSESEYEAFLSSYGQEHRFSLRVNPLKCRRERFLELASGEGPAGEGLELRPVPWEPDGFYYPEALRPGRHPRHEAGMYYIQEASAMAPAMLCGARPGERILDLCAAPGGKSTKLAASLRGEGILVANEIHPERAKILSANLERTGVRNAVVTCASPQQLASHFPLFFDRVVVDAPCSGEGMFRKEEEALRHWSMENVRMCSERQIQILEEAAAMLRPGGTLVYSTCTFAPEENEGVIFRFLMDHPDYSVVPAGEQFEKKGFSRGRPEWLETAGILPPTECSSNTGKDTEAGKISQPEQYSGRSAACAAQLSGTVRLWPHLVEGEGHFAAVLRKQERQGRENPDRPDRYYQDPEQQPPENRKWQHRELPEQKKQVWEKQDHPFRNQGNVRTGSRDMKQRGKGAKGTKGGKGNDSARQRMLAAWKEFHTENLLPAGEDAEERLVFFGDVLYRLPASLPSVSLDGLRVLRAGLQLGTLKKDRFEPSHSLGMALKGEEVRRSVEFAGDSREAWAWIRGESVPVEAGQENGWTLVLIDGCAAGWGKVSGGMLKNHYPKGLRRQIFPES